MTAALATLKKNLADLVPVSPTGSDITGLASGIDALDSALPSRGIPMGRLTELLGARGSGKTTFLRHLVQVTLGKGLWVAYVDASRSLAPRDWAGLDEEASAIRNPQSAIHQPPSAIRGLQSDLGLWIIRPTSPSKGTWAADVLLRSGAFALVVLDGTAPLSRSVAVRLTRLARSAGAALVVTGEESAAAIPGALRLRVERGRKRRTTNYELRTANQRPGTANCELRTTKHELRTANQKSSRNQPEIKPSTSQVAVRSSQLAVEFAVRSSQFSSQSAVRSSQLSSRFEILVEKGGIRRRIEVSYGVGLASRLCAHPEVLDRRGVAGKRNQEPGASGQKIGNRAGARLRADGIGRADAIGDHLDDRRADSPPSLPPGQKQHPRARARRCAESDFGRKERNAARIAFHAPEPTTTVSDPQPAIPASLSAGRNQQSTIRKPESAIHSPQSAIRNPQSAIPDPRSALRTPAAVG